MATSYEDSRITLRSSINEINNLSICCSDCITVSQLLTIIEFKLFSCIADNFELQHKYMFVNNEIPIFAQIDYKLFDFLNNFNIDHNNVIIEISPYYQCGATGGIDFVSFTIHPCEPHFEPHVHISRNGDKTNSYRISIRTLKQLKGDKIKWNNEFKLKERKRIIKIIKENKKSLIDFYERMRKGEYIDECLRLYEDEEEICAFK